MTGIIILAAGSSGRFGSPKQNLVFEGQTLLQRTIETAMASKAGQVIVILGANADLIQPTIKGMPVSIIQNADWREGMASSIRLGITELKKLQPTANSAILMLCDQPFANAGILNKLIEKKSEKAIVACTYNEAIGVPVLFNARYFDELLQLKGQEGAKKVLKKYADDIATVPFPLGSVDIDTMADFEKIKRGKIT